MFNTYTLIYDFEDSYDYFEYTIEKSCEDILEYEFKKTFEKDYSNFLLTEEQKKFIKDFEDKCNHNMIHYYDYYTTLNFDFLDWLKDKYQLEAEEMSQQEDEDFDDWWSQLSDNDKKEIYEENEWR